MKKLLALALVSILSLSLTQAAEGWLTNYADALSQAKSEKQLVLLDFTGSDWCPPCMMLEKQTLSQKEFSDFAEGKVVLVSLDFPRTKEISASLKAQNEKLASKYNIEGFPTLVLLDSEGKELARHVGFLPGGPKALITWINENKG
jgi:thioredoxin-related protein